MNTPTSTPRTDAAWASSFEPCEYRAAHTARTMREHSQQLETELAAERQKVRTLREALRRIEDAAYKHSFDGDVLAWAGDVATDALAIAATKEGAK